MTLTLIVAMARNRVIGRVNTLPWHLPSELQFFKRVTMGKPIIMGRKTHESIGRALPGRRNIVVSRNPDFRAAADCIVVNSLDAALDTARSISSANEIMLIGGAELYRQALAKADRIYLTRVEAEIEGDTFFPELPAEQWREVWRESFPADARHAYAHTRCLLERLTAYKDASLSVEH
jgi:dihydrofolate reductase